MAHLGELVGSLAADTLGRRVRRQQVGSILLDLAQLFEDRVVLGVRSLGLVEHVVGVLVAANQLAQFLYAHRRVNCFFPLRHFVSGDRVTHPAFGAGTVVKSTLTRTDEELVIKFDRVGLKILSGMLAPLTK